MTVAVYDTNVLIFGIFWRGLPRRAIHLARKGEVRVVTCQTLLDELRDVLVRANKPFRLSEDEAARVISDVLTYVHLVTPTRQITVCRDPDDNLVLACALAGQAEYVVTGDPDLLTLEELEGMKIITVREFLSALQAL